MRVFFYGLFMDEELLANKGITTSDAAAGFADGFRLHIGERATLMREPDSRAYGVIMNIDPVAIAELYAEASVADYLPETILVEDLDGTRMETTCYNLPPGDVSGTNQDYAKQLLTLASKLGFPDSYLAQIRRLAN